MSTYYGIPLLLGSAGAYVVAKMFEEDVSPPEYGEGDIPYATAVSENKGFFGE
jgi:hypothetical protein